MASSLDLTYASPNSTTLFIGGDVDLYYQHNMGSWTFLSASTGETKTLDLNQHDVVSLKSPGAGEFGKHIVLTPASYDDHYRIRGYLSALITNGEQYYTSNLHDELQGLFKNWSLENFGLEFGFWKIPDEGFKELFANSTLDKISYGFENLESIGTGAFKSTFENCKNLTEVPGDLFSYLTSEFFQGLAPNCFERMFAGCDGLTQLPQNLLPLLHIPAYACAGMFAECKSLTKVDKGVIRATSCDAHAFDEMFRGCTNLNYVGTELKAWPENGNIDWLKDVSATGEFNGPKQLPKTRGDSFIPATWGLTVFNPERCLRFSNRKLGSYTVSIDHSPVDDSPYLFSGDGGVTWAEGPITVDASSVFYCKGTNYPALEDSTADTAAKFVITPDSNAVPQIDGSIMSLVDNGAGELDEIADGYGFAYLFANNAYLGSVSSPSLLSASKLSKNCYKGMFSNCPFFSYVCPSMMQNASVLAEGCCEQMFMNTKLIVGPKLPAKDLVKDCYKEMFRGDIELNRVEVGFTDFKDGLGTTDWLKDTKTEWSTGKPGIFWCPEELVIPSPGTDSTVTERFERDVFLPFNPDKCFKITVLNIEKGVNISYRPLDLTAYPDIVRFSRDGKFWTDSRIGIHVEDGETVYVCSDKFPVDRQNTMRFTSEQTTYEENSGIRLSGSLTSFIDGGAGALFDFDNPHWSTPNRFGTFQGFFLSDITSWSPVRIIEIGDDLFNFKNVKRADFFASMFWRQGIKKLPKNLFKTIEALDEFGIFQNMFAENQLTTVADLPNAKLYYSIPPEYGHFSRMYSKNIQLKKVDASVIPKNLIKQVKENDGLFSDLFSGCENLSEISVEFNEWKDLSTSENQNPFYHWAENVAATGDFYGPGRLPQIFNGSHIPFSWTFHILPKVGKVSFLGKYSMSTSL